MTATIDLALVRQGDVLLAEAYRLAGDNGETLATRQAQWIARGMDEEERMPDETPRRGRPRNAIHSTQTMIRMAPDLLRRIEAYRQRMNTSNPGLDLTMAHAIRILLERGLASESPGIAISTPQNADDTQPFTENITSQYEQHSLPLAPEPVQPMEPARKSKSLSSRRKDGRGGNPGIPDEKLQQIADERTQYEGLSLRDFAQRLFDKGIYRSKAENGSEVPVNRGTITKWFKRAREAGML